MFSKKLIVAMMFMMMLAVGSAQAGGDAAKGAELASSGGCADCHGENGIGDADYPKLAGLEEEMHVKLLKGFVGSEDSEMADYVAELSEQDMADIAAYYKSLAE